MRDNSDLGLNFLISCSDNLVYEECALKEIQRWWDMLDEINKDDYLDCLDGMERFDGIWLGGYWCTKSFIVADGRWVYEIGNVSC